MRKKRKTLTISLPFSVNSKNPVIVKALVFHNMRNIIFTAGHEFSYHLPQKLLSRAMQKTAKTTERNSSTTV